MRSPELTIGVTAWNSAPFLSPCLESIEDWREGAVGLPHDLETALAPL
jgi:hypothetical protein